MEIYLNNPSQGQPRLFQLSNKDVIEVNGILLEYDDKVLYEVRRVREWFTIEYRRTGKSFTPDEINEMVK